jgi:hypothetical protein
MSVIGALLSSIAAQLRASLDETDQPIFRDVRVELDRYDLGDLLKQSTLTPLARVCFQKSKMRPRSDGGMDCDVSIALVLAASRSGRANPEFSSADLAVVDLLMATSAVILRDPYFGLTQLSAAQLGDQMVAVSDESGGVGIAIAAMEIGVTLYDCLQARPIIQEAIETGRYPWEPDTLEVNGAPQIRTVGG